MKLNKKNVVITSAARTAIGTFNGSLKNMHGHDMGALVIKEVIKKSKLKSKDVDELVMGQVLTSAVGQNPARQAAIKAGMPIEKTAYVINQVCGSGLRSVAAGYAAVVHATLLIPMILLGQIILWSDNISLNRLWLMGKNNNEETD